MLENLSDQWQHLCAMTGEIHPLSAIAIAVWLLYCVWPSAVKTCAEVVILFLVVILAMLHAILRGLVRLIPAFLRRFLIRLLSADLEAC